MEWPELSKVILSAASVAVIGGAIYAIIKFLYYLATLKKTRRESLKVSFDRTVDQLSSNSKSSQLSAAVLLRRFLGTKVARKYPYLEKETINVISSLAKTLPTNVFQKTLVDGLAYASDLSLCDLQKTNLQDALIDNKKRPVLMNETDLFLSDLSYANIKGVTGHGIIFYRAILFCARIKNCDFTNANFRGADLTGVAFKDCILNGADFTDALNVPPSIKKELQNGVFPVKKDKKKQDVKITAKHESNEKTVFFSMPGKLTKEDELLTKDIKTTLEGKGYKVIYYKRDQYPNFGQFNQVRESIAHSSAMVAFGLKQLNIEKASYRPGTEEERSWDGKWLSTPWSEIEVGMGLMKGMPILLVCDPAIDNGVFDSGLSECFVATIYTTEDCKKLEQNEKFIEWLSKI